MAWDTIHAARNWMLNIIPILTSCLEGVNQGLVTYILFTATANRIELRRFNMIDSLFQELPDLATIDPHAASISTSNNTTIPTTTAINKWLRYSRIMRYCCVAQIVLQTFIFVSSYMSKGLTWLNVSQAACFSASCGCLWWSAVRDEKKMLSLLENGGRGDVETGVGAWEGEGRDEKVGKGDEKVGLLDEKKEVEGHKGRVDKKEKQNMEVKVQEVRERSEN
ncbi:uncharacterized protein J4E87_007006 [Alternaria ethzedia]|uniref:uncharacterized protein n=1 Tax=Alternaria ethzedia TaxID=181014 RepID=UPI0020C55B41|nr:uncharacterized protein J4E87_007006 [Alternaria ethzedia]KAI4620680.1 hypothetical protein J4E87_007006 [Alternaria ethzedia]